MCDHSTDLARRVHDAIIGWVVANVSEDGQVHRYAAMHACQHDVAFGSLCDVDGITQLAHSLE
jgi:hypothetical protein